MTGSLKSTLVEVLGLTTPDEALNLSLQMKLTNGTGAEEVANQMWVGQKRTLANGASENLDLYGVLTNFRGQVVNFKIIRGLIIVNYSTVSSLLYGGAASNQWHPMFVEATGVGIVRPASTNYPAWIEIAAPDVNGLPVVAGTADILKMAHGSEDSADLIYGIAIVGEV